MMHQFSRQILSNQGRLAHNLVGYNLTKNGGMFLPEPQRIEVARDLSGLDDSIRTAPNVAAVFLLWPHQGSPYLGRTTLLRRRLVRLLRARDHQPRLLNLRSVVSRIDYWLTGSSLEAALLSYELARRHFPETYLDLLKLRMPPYVKLILSSPFPRTQVTARLSAASALFCGPFRSRPAAEQFEAQCLDQFQLRRCQEDLKPATDHPGCIYGEMNMCLRPCQRVVGIEEYRTEARRVAEFLSTGGDSLRQAIAAARDRLSEEMNFEEAGRQHKRLQEIDQVLRLRENLAGDIDRLNGACVTRSGEPDAVELWFLLKGCWLAARRFHLGATDGKSVSLDHRLRELAAQLTPARITIRERQEHLAILARWYYSSWRDGEWIPFEDLNALPYRKMVNAIHRVATADAPASQPP